MLVLLVQHCMLPVVQRCMLLVVQHCMLALHMPVAALHVAGHMFASYMQLCMHVAADVAHMLVEVVHMLADTHRQVLPAGAGLHSTLAADAAALAEHVPVPVGMQSALQLLYPLFPFSLASPLPRLSAAHPGDVCVLVPLLRLFLLPDGNDQ